MMKATVTDTATNGEVLDISVETLDQDALVRAVVDKLQEFGVTAENAELTCQTALRYRGIAADTGYNDAMQHLSGYAVSIDR